jgi:hypothetical protein
VAKESERPSPKIFFLHILANSGQSSGGHTALLIGNKVYHFQYNFQDKILHIVRDPWEEFRFHYGVWENRSMTLYELGIPPEKKENFISHWDQSYLIQSKWIKNQADMSLDKLWLNDVVKSERSKPIVFGISGLGYFNQKEKSELKFINLTQEEESGILLQLEALDGMASDFSPTHNSLLTANQQIEASSHEGLAFTPPDRYRSIFKIKEEREQKKFAREFLLAPTQWNPDEFLVLNQKSEFQLTDSDIDRLKNTEEQLIGEIKTCIQTIESCNGIQELVYLIRLHAVRESLALGYFVVPKKANYRPFYFSEQKEIPTHVKAEKSKESIRLFQISKREFFETSGELSFNEWEKDMAKIDSLQREAYDIVDFESYPTNKGDRNILVTEEEREKSMGLSKLANATYDKYEQLIQNIYPYHIIFKNCTSEIFRYHNNFYPSQEERSEVFGGTVSDQTRSFSFVPFLAAEMVEANYRISSKKEILSYRILKKRSEDLSLLRNAKEDFLPTSQIYEKNPYDQEYLLFTDDTIALRPIYGLANISWGLGASTLGIFRVPWDKGEMSKKGLQSVFFSFPELLFFNIRKGYFPYVTGKDLPESYFEKPEK